MSRFISIRIVVSILMINLVSMSPSSAATDTHYVAQHRTVIQNAQGHVKHRKLLLSKIQRAVLFGADDDSDDDVQNEDVATGYRRRDLTKIEHKDDISEDIRWRLFLARQLAMLKYREVHG